MAADKPQAAALEDAKPEALEDAKPEASDSIVEASDSIVEFSGPATGGPDKCEALDALVEVSGPAIGGPDKLGAGFKRSSSGRSLVACFGDIEVLEDRPAGKSKGKSDGKSDSKSYMIRRISDGKFDSKSGKKEPRKEPKKIAKHSLFCIGINNPIRRLVIRGVESRWCDRIILLCIGINSVLLAIEKHRAPPDDLQNRVADVIATILSAIFLVECVSKIIGWGFRVYISDAWNILDFVVVVSAVIEWIPWIPFGGLGFLRLFRVLRPLRSLNSVPEMKVLVNTTVSAVPRLGNVAALGVFIFLVFAIVGVTLLNGIFYRQCHETQNPTLIFSSSDNQTQCWEWVKIGDDKLCGGAYLCTHVEDGFETRSGYCGGHEFDEGGLAPVFESPLDSVGPMRGGGIEWCEGSKPAKVRPELDFIHFDHLAGAFLLIFQCMTMEGWTDIMYYVKDSFSFWFAVLYFFLLIVVTSHFLLNVALAVVDEVRDDFDNEDEAEPETEHTGSWAAGVGDDEEVEKELWQDNGAVRFCTWLTSMPAWQNFVLLIITANVVVMMMVKFPPDVVLDEILEYINKCFLGIFVLEMMIEIVARGPLGYLKNYTTLFDGFVVMVSLIETAMLMASGGGTSALQALRTLRLFRVLNKFASKNPKIAILLKSMVGTAKALKYWLVLFVLVLYICTLMWMNFFANTLQFEDPDTLAVSIGRYHLENGDEVVSPWCLPDQSTPLARKRQDWHFKQDCIPRAHFDNFGWGFVTVFQIMTGENWNSVMYAGMRATRANNMEWAFGILYMALLLFGQILFLSLFLSMLLSKFDEFRQELQDEEEARKRLADEKKLRLSSSLKEADGVGSPSLGRWAQMSNGMENMQESHQSIAALYKMKELMQRSRWNRPEVTRVKPMMDEEMEEEESSANENAWPHGWSWFLMPPEFPLRVVANDFLNRTVDIKVPGFGKANLNVFETFILLCILLSTVCMMIDFPLANPENLVIKTVRIMDTIFACIFIAEMVLKLVAWPVLWGEGAYLWSKGCAWNWLDFIVVSVSVMGFIGDGPSTLKTLRILRAFRPLRVVKRLETLRNIVEAIFNSMKELGVLLIVFLLFLLIFALVFMMYLNGTLYACSENEVWFHRDLGDPDFERFTMPLCLSGAGLASAQVRGEFDEAADAWNVSAATCGQGAHEGFEVAWQRASPDTPICVGRCDPLWRAPFNSTFAPPPDLCPRPYLTAEELPHTCSEQVAEHPGRNTYKEEIGFLYIEKMQAFYVVPCGGSTALSFTGADEAKTGAGWGSNLQGGSLDSAWADVMGTPAQRMSCRQQFCPDVDEGRMARCKHESEIHPNFCADTCGKDKESGACKSCREEYQAACECPDFCTPLIKDAALCVEQGGEWQQVLSQNFDNVFNAMLALVEISTTEGWVNSMYAACDTSFSPYVQPLRDTNAPIWMFMFVMWILLSFMFLMNLGVGIIVDKFMEMRAEGKDNITPSQRRWLKSRMSLGARSTVFNLQNLHLLPSWRRQVYDVVEHRFFERFIMSCIVFNTVLMALVTFPELETADTAWWRNFVSGANYTFVSVFTIEAILKLLALQRNYWKETWNVFDFSCVFATIAGIILSVANTGINISSVASVIRILRIARILKLLKFKALRPLNKLFRSLAISLVKLANVGVVAFLFLILFSILGVNVFSGVSTTGSDTFNEHANFRHFVNAFTLLFRASTGEAWNEIMHDLSKDQVDWFRQGSWCTPAELFDTEASYYVLKEKCLIDNPNACVVDLIPGWCPIPWMYWVSYTLFMGLVIMNVVIAVILEGYEETKSSDEVSIIETCRTLWGSKYDRDHRMVITFPEACRFIVESITELQKDGSIAGDRIPEIDVPTTDDTNNMTGCDLSRFPMKFAKALDITPRNFVTFEAAVKQVVRFAAVVESPDDDDVVPQLDNCDSQLQSKEMKKILELEAKKAEPGLVPGEPLASHIAAMMMQRMVREALARYRKRKQRNRMGNAGDCEDDEKRKLELKRQHDIYLKCIARAIELGATTGVRPPMPG
mmetsp:Transcript_88811/g.287113  ORF Transcript_88811/g.287113 Transcript_88811/m.287113 type:complete len:2023 (+) Transcript_88811:144-6212(+)